MPLPDLDFLLESSVQTLQDVELSALARSSGLSKALRRELEMWIEQSATAMLARFLLDNREAILGRSVTPEVGPKSVDLFSKERKKSA